MRISDVNKDNYMDFLKLFDIKSPKSLDSLLRKDEKQANSSNSYIEPGMDITGRDPSSYKMVKVSDEIREKLVSHARSEFVNNYGKTDGEELSTMMKEYLKGVPASERADVSWTLGQIFVEESRRLSDTVKANNPGWQPGQVFDQGAVSDLISRPSVDRKV